jgi:4-hydroxy-tetrahydrodipicolinate synthase
MPQPHGVISAMLTPFTSPSGPVDYGWLPAYLRFLEDSGLHGVLAMGTTGEGPSMSVAERAETLEVILAHRGNLAVIAGTGCASLTDTIELSRRAMTAGADAVLVMPPFYIKNVSEAGVVGYYRALCDGLPAGSQIMLYNIPQVTGVPVTPAIIDGILATHAQQLYGLKDSSGNWDNSKMLIDRYPQLKVFTGSDKLVSRALAGGAAGAITALSSAFPRLPRAVYDAHFNGGDVAKAQDILTRVRDLVDAGNTPPQLKSALTWTSNLPATHLRWPFVPISAEAGAELRAAYEAIVNG